jgi:kynurenine formamidase
MSDLLKLLETAKVYDLAQSYFVGMPHHPAHPPFLYSLTKQHGDYTVPGGGSSASDALALGSHLGTHIDALCHFSCDGKLHGGQDVASVQSYAGGMRKYSIDTVAPIVRRGVLLDIAGQQKLNALPADFTITPSHMEEAAKSQGVKIEKGNVVLVRTGWGSFFDDAARFEAQMHGPGPAEEGARWLSKHGIVAAGSDTIAFELMPSRFPVHIHLLVESGIHIIECLNLEQLATERVYEFAFVATPLKIKGGTGSPIRPLALTTPTHW